MKALNVSDLRKNLGNYLRSVVDDFEAIIVPLTKGRSVVIVSKEEYDSWKETEYLTRTEAHRMGMLESMLEIESGDAEFVEVNLDALEADADNIFKESADSVQPTKREGKRKSKTTT